MYFEIFIQRHVKNIAVLFKVFTLCRVPLLKIRATYKFICTTCIKQNKIAIEVEQANSPSIHTSVAAVDISPRGTRLTASVARSRDSDNEIARRSERPAVARVHAPAVAIRSASLIKINYICRVIVRLIESRYSAAIPMRHHRSPFS